MYQHYFTIIQFVNWISHSGIEFVLRNIIKRDWEKTANILVENVNSEITSADWWKLYKFHIFSFAFLMTFVYPQYTVLFTIVHAIFGSILARKAQKILHETSDHFKILSGCVMAEIASVLIIGFNHGIHGIFLMAYASWICETMYERHPIKLH